MGAGGSLNVKGQQMVSGASVVLLQPLMSPRADS